MEHSEYITGKSLTSVLHSKFVDYVEERTMKNIALDFFLSVSASFAAGLLVDPSLTSRVIRWHDGIIPTLTLLLVAAVHAKWLVRSLWNLIETLTPETPVVTEDTIEGIPKIELIDHMIVRGSLKVKETTEKFHVPQNRAEELIKNLKRVTVLVPGPNNASILNPQMSRQDIATILKGKSSARDLEPLFRRDELGLTSRPSMPEIEERAKEETTPPLSAPIFTSRTLASAR